MNAPGNEIVVYQPDDTTRLEVRLAEDTIWLTQEQMAGLFQRDRSVVNRHIRNVFAEGELPEGGNVHFLHIPSSDKPVKAFSLNVVISVGYRVKSLRGTQFRIWATQVLKTYLLRGYAFRQRLSQLEDRMDRRLGAHEERLGALEGKVDFFVRTSLPPVQGVFFDGQMFDAAAFAARHILSARTRILLIDPWIDFATLELLAKKSPGVAVEIVTSPRGNRLSPDDIARFNAQYGGLTVKESTRFHDRFLAIDGRTLYVIGASLKDLGRKCFAFFRLDASLIPALRARALRAQ